MENAVRALERPFAPRHSLFRHRQARRQQDNQQSGPNRLVKFDYGIALVPRMANYANLVSRGMMSLSRVTSVQLSNQVRYEKASISHVANFLAGVGERRRRGRRGRPLSEFVDHDLCASPGLHREE